MAAIKITALNSDNTVKARHLFKDLYLDLEFGQSKSNQFFKKNEVSDLKESLDYDAIRNSLYNLFNTNQGERLLTPDFGLNLRKMLFSPISKTNGILIGDIIKAGIAKYEPRVTLQQIIVVADEDNLQYLISLSFTVEELSTKTLTIPGILTNTGYSFIY